LSEKESSGEFEVVVVVVEGKGGVGRERSVFEEEFNVLYFSCN
jgi:hypothetical protein